MAKAGSSIARVREDAERLGLRTEIQTMDSSTRTAEDAARACGCAVAQIVKSLIFEDARTGGLVLLLVSGSHNADTAYIDAAYGLSLTRCDARRVRDETGFAIGGVSPIGLLSPVPTYMDRTILDFPVVWCAAGRPDSIFSVAPDILRDAVEAIMIDVQPSPEA